MSVKCFINLLPLLLIFGQSTSALAQVEPDVTLGSESPQLRFQDNQIIIRGGSDRVSILFHRFDQFSIADF